MLTLDRVKGITLTDEQQEPFRNEILRLNQLAAGLAFLYATVRGLEEDYPPSASFVIGNDPSTPGIPRPLVLCMFQWYATAVCNLTRLIGLIAHEADLKGFEQRTSILEYCADVCGPVKVYRDKVAAHFARVAPRGDNPADQARSVIDDLTRLDARFWVGLVKVHFGEVSPSHEYAWSLTEFHERQAKRYQPPGGEPTR